MSTVISVQPDTRRFAMRSAAWRRVAAHGLTHSHSHQLLEPFRIERGTDHPIHISTEMDMLGRRFWLSVSRSVAGEVLLHIMDSKRRKGGMTASAFVDLIIRRGVVIARVPEKIQRPRFGGWSPVDLEAILTHLPEPVEQGFQWSDLRATRARSSLAAVGFPITAETVPRLEAAEACNAAG